MKDKCGVINDLLPLYVDGICSEESKQMVEEHLAECEMCKKEMDMLKSDMAIPAETNDVFIRQIKKRIRIQKAVIAVIVALVLLVFLGGAGAVGVIKMFNEWSSMDSLVDADMLDVKEDENGDVWLVRKGVAVDASNIVMNQYTPEGMIITDFKKKTIHSDADKSHVVIHLELYTNPATMLKYKVVGETSMIEEEQSLLFNKAERENFDKIVWMDEETDSEQVLWER